MAKISFRQGIVSYPTDATSGIQSFLKKNGSNVDIIVDAGSSSTPITVAFAHQDTDYLYTESKTISGAWTNINSGTTYYLYWDINLDSGAVTRGNTTLKPIYSSTEPKSQDRVKGQMWFDISDSTFKVWQGSVWIEVIRVMAAQVLNGTQFKSLSVNASSTNFAGTQVGKYSNIRGSRNVGSLVYNSSGNAIKSGERNQFFTTEDTFLTGVPTGASTKINNVLVTGIAASPLAAFQVVQFDDYNSIALANAFEQGKKLFGIVESDVDAGEVTSFVSEGVIYNENWDWEAQGVSVNTSLYIDQSLKTLTTNIPVDNSTPVGVIIGAKEVYFAPRIFPQVTVTTGASGGGLTSNQSSQLTAATTQAANNAALLQSHDSLIAELGNDVESFEQAIADIDIKIDGLLPLTGGTMTGKLILSGAPTQNLEAATKSYVDSISNGFQTAIVLNEWAVVGNTGNAENQLTISQSFHGLSIGTFFNVICFNEDGRRISVEYGVDLDTGDVTLYTRGKAFSGTVRIM